MTAPHIEFQNVSTRYGSKEVLDGVSFAIQRNEIFGIIGPANSGKTTILKAINRTLEFITGAHRTGGIRISGEETVIDRRVLDELDLDEVEGNDGEPAGEEKQNPDAAGAGVHGAVTGCWARK